MKEDKGQYVKKYNGDKSINEKWLEIHQPDKAQRNKNIFKKYGRTGWQQSGKGSLYPKK